MCTPTLKDCIFLAVGASFRRDLGKAFQIGTTQAGKALSELELVNLFLTGENVLGCCWWRDESVEMEQVPSVGGGSAVD